MKRREGGVGSCHGNLLQSPGSLNGGDPDGRCSLYYSVLRLLSDECFSHGQCHMYSTSHPDNMALTDHQLTFWLQFVTVRVSAHRGEKAVASGEPITQSLTHTHTLHTPTEGTMSVRVLQ